MKRSPAYLLSRSRPASLGSLFGPAALALLTFGSVLPASAQYPPAQSPSGQTPPSQAPAGRAPSAKPPAAQPPVGQAPVGKAPGLQAPVGVTPGGQVLGGQAEGKPQPVGPLGLWYDDSGKGAVEIKPCGPNLCGNIVWLREPTATSGQPVVDANNPDKSKRVRPVCGLQVLGNVKPQGDGTWDAGWVYDPKVGKSYDVAIELDGRDRLTVTGYKGIKLLSKKLTWTRVKTELPRCDTAEIRAGADLPGNVPPGNGAAAPRSAGSPAQGAAPGAAPAQRPAATLPPLPGRP